jgi:hypothetical protein
VPIELNANQRLPIACSRHSKENEMLKSTLAVSALVLGFASPAAAQAPPQLITGTNGEIESTFPANNCVVYYDASGRRKSANPNCSSGQISQSDVGVAAYRREQGMDGYPGDEAPPGGFRAPSNHHGPPEVVMDRHGRSHVLVGSQCIVYYGRDGTRERNENPYCSSRDRRAADDAMRAYRREQGLRPNHPSGYAYGIPVIRLRNGNYQATVSSTCTVYFNDRGGLLTYLPKCTIAEKANASIAVLQYRRSN